MVTRDKFWPPFLPIGDMETPSLMCDRMEDLSEILKDSVNTSLVDNSL
jgi:hypothetical protein